MHITKLAVLSLTNGGALLPNLEDSGNAVVCQTPTPSPIRFVKRPATLLEKLAEQNMMYAPCRCGSGKKYRFCCYAKDGRPRHEIQL